LPAPFVNQLFELVFSLPCTLAKEIEVSAVAMSITAPSSSIGSSIGSSSGSGSGSEGADSWGGGGGGGGGSTVLAGLLLRAVSAHMDSLTPQQCQERVGDLSALLSLSLSLSLSPEDRSARRGSTRTPPEAPPASEHTSTTLSIQQPALPFGEMDFLKSLSSMFIPVRH
jgi:hypothetical protein